MCCRKMLSLKGLWQIICVANVEKYFNMNNSNRLTNDQETEALGIAEIFGHLLQGGTAGEVIGIDENENEAIYTLGYFKYSNGKYADALKLFQLVVLHDHLHRRGLKALGSCLQVLRRHEEAIKPLGLAMLLDPADPGPAFQIAECMLYTGKKENAVLILDKLVEEFGQADEHVEIINKARGLSELIKYKKIID